MEGVLAAFGPVTGCYGRSHQFRVGDKGKLWGRAAGPVRMATKPADIETIKHHIAEIVDPRLADGSHVLLNVVGIALKDDLARLKYLTGKTLAQFVETEMGDKYRLARQAGRENIVILLPVGRHSEAVSAEPSGEEKITFRRELWQAFTTPLELGKQRAFNVQEMQFQDIAETAKPPSGFVAIPTQLLPRPGNRWYAPQVMLNISGWLEASDIDPEQFVTRHRPSDLRAQLSEAPRNVLEAVLASLDQSQLRGMSMSLDIVATLLRKRI